MLVFINLKRENDMKENKIILITMFFNSLVAIIKLATGIIFSFSTLIADSIQSFLDIITDIISLIVNKIGKRRANKTYPFGYGQVYNLANMFTGVLLFLIGIFIMYQFFFFEGHFVPKKILFIILVAVVCLKLVVVNLLKYYGKVYKSESMIEASKESSADLISTCVVLGVSILITIEKYLPFTINFDKLGSLGIAIYVFYTSIKMIVSNIKGILTNDEENDEMKHLIEEELNKYKNIKTEGIRIIKMANYYTVFIQLRVERDLTIRQYIKIERKIKFNLKYKYKQIKHIDIEPV